MGHCPLLTGYWLLANCQWSLVTGPLSNAPAPAPPLHAPPSTLHHSTTHCALTHSHIAHRTLAHSHCFRPRSASARVGTGSGTRSGLGPRALRAGASGLRPPAAGRGARASPDSSSELGLPTPNSQLRSGDISCLLSPASASWKLEGEGWDLGCCGSGVGAVGRWRPTVGLRAFRPLDRSSTSCLLLLGPGTLVPRSQDLGPAEWHAGWACKHWGMGDGGWGLGVWERSRALRSAHHVT